MKFSAARTALSSFLRLNGFALLLCAGLLPSPVHAQLASLDNATTRSVSGQFIISPAPFSRLAAMPSIAADTNLVRLEPSLLSVSAERIRNLVWHKLDISPDAPWRGKIFLALYPARSIDEDVTIISQSSANGWNYQVQLPDVLSQTRLLRAMTSVVLLEIANRNSTARHSAEIPAWLIDGLARQITGAFSPSPILSAPGKLIFGLPQNRTIEVERGTDPLADAHRILRDRGTLTFEQLSWPTAQQSSGEDGGVYWANAEVFVDELLNLKNGPAGCRAMLARLPGCYNWQTAFQSAFRAYFPQPLDVEKWWALQVVSFVAHEPGPHWTLMVSRERLDEILSVPVNVWEDSNAMPAHTEISLQSVIRNFQPPERTEILQTRLRDLELAQLHIAPPLVELCDQYRRVLGDFIGQPEPRVSTRPIGKHPVPVPKAGNVPLTLKKLDLLDARRHMAEAGMKPNALAP